jgi:hypothetical protein
MFNAFTNIHNLEMNKERKWDTIQLVALKINFQNRFVKDKKNE